MIRLLRAGVLPCFLLFCYGSGVAAQTTAADNTNTTRGVDEFLTSLTQMIGTVLNSDARYSQLLDGGGVDDENALQSISGRPNRPSPVADYFDYGRPPFSGPQNGGRPPYPPSFPGQQEGGRPQPPFPGNGGPGGPGGPGGFDGGRPPFPYRPYPGGPGRYPAQNSVLQALSSIAEHDDLRCVPRLLCEVSSGTRPTSGHYRPGYNQKQQQQSSIPFLSKDALITLLTVLNFVDDSPLLMFGRAALLGYNARDDPRSCTTAYPTCPRDPEQLINYLNNHNGGFFRFFNQQLPQYAPQYAPYQQPPYQRPPHQRPPYQQPPYQQLPYQEQPPNQQPPYQQPLYPAQQQYAPLYPRPSRPHLQGAYKTRADLNDAEDSQRLRTSDGGDHESPRILSGSPSQYYDVPSVHDLALEVPRPLMTFPSDDHSGAANSVLPFVFPSETGDNRGNRKSKKIKMVFPDRTGTGGLRAELDQYGNYKGVYYANGAIKFVDDKGDGRPSKVSLPTWSSRPANSFDVLGNRLPYEKRPKFQFPRGV